jgi:methanogenic corrinoid protein MtbC1
VDRLRLVARALALGHRAGEVVPASLARLKALAGEDDRSAGRADREWRRDVLSAALAYDRNAASRLLGESAARGVRPFLDDLDALFEEVGAAWSGGRLAIAQEHFLTELAEDQVRALRAPLDARLHGPALLLASLTGERHALGLQAVALMASALGLPVQILGAQTPLEEIARAASLRPALAVGVSVSPASAGRVTVEGLNGLARALPAAVELWAGGAGASSLEGLEPGVLKISGPARLEREIRRLARSGA